MYIHIGVQGSNEIMFIYGISTNLLDTSTVLRVHYLLNQPYILYMRHGNQEKNYRVFQKNCAFTQSI